MAFIIVFCSLSEFSFCNTIMESMFYVITVHETLNFITHKRLKRYSEIQEA